MSFRKMIKVWVLALCAAVPAISHADNADWVIGDVALIEDMRAQWPDSGILVGLTNKTYYGTGGTVPTVCTERYRLVVGLEGITADIQKSIMTILLAARLSGDKVRLLVSPDNVNSTGSCAIRAVSMGVF